VKSELKRHLLPLLAIFIFISIFWIASKVSFLNFIYLFFGLLLGSFFLDVDHLVYWLYLNPNVEESRLAQIAFQKYDFRSLVKLLESTHQQHTSLVFHHFFFQMIMALFSIFVFTSSDNPFATAFLLALNVHLLVDEIIDFRRNPKHLQNWLFARETKQLPLRYLPQYIAIFTFLTFIFTLLLLKSKT
jgi:hypothetical protein